MAGVQRMLHLLSHYIAPGGGGRGYLGNSQGTAWALPDGDDLLGLTAHTPGQPLQPPATPVQDGRLDRAAADTATTQSAPYSPARSVAQAQAIAMQMLCAETTCFSLSVSILKRQDARVMWNTFFQCSDCCGFTLMLQHHSLACQKPSSLALQCAC